MFAPTTFIPNRLSRFSPTWKGACMRKTTASLAALGAAAALVLSACSSSGGNNSGNSPSGNNSSNSGSGKIQVGVILPDTTSSTRYTEFDAPLLTKAFKAAGIGADIQNAGG